jgi:hypothetical protein
MDLKTCVEFLYDKNLASNVYAIGGGPHSSNLILNSYLYNSTLFDASILRVKNK